MLYRNHSNVLCIQQCRGFCYYRIAGIIRWGQFSRKGEPFVLWGVFVGLKFADPIPPLYFAGLFFMDETQPCMNDAKIIPPRIIPAIRYYTRSVFWEHHWPNLIIVYPQACFFPPPTTTHLYLYCISLACMEHILWLVHECSTFYAHKLYVTSAERGKELVSFTCGGACLQNRIL